MTDTSLHVFHIVSQVESSVHLGAPHPGWSHSATFPYRRVRLYVLPKLDGVLPSRGAVVALFPQHAFGLCATSCLGLSFIVEQSIDYLLSVLGAVGC